MDTERRLCVVETDRRAVRLVKKLNQFVQPRIKHKTQKIVHCLIRENPGQSVAILNFSLGARPQNDFCRRGFGPMPILSGIVCTIFTVWAKRRKLLLRHCALLSKRAPREQEFVGFSYNFR